LAIEPFVAAAARGVSLGCETLIWTNILVAAQNRLRAPRHEAAPLGEKLIVGTDPMNTMGSATPNHRYRSAFRLKYKRQKDKQPHSNDGLQDANRKKRSKIPTSELALLCSARVLDGRLLAADKSKAIKNGSSQT
jgi:hypothetical protein